jgi:hypothetical protein
VQFLKTLLLLKVTLKSHQIRKLLQTLGDLYPRSTPPVRVIQGYKQRLCSIGLVSIKGLEKAGNHGITSKYTGRQTAGSFFPALQWRQ